MFAFLVALWLAAVAAARLQTVYNTNFTTAYVQTANGTLYTVAIPPTSQSKAELLQNFRSIASPPHNSTLLVDQTGDLLATHCAQSSTTSAILVSRYASHLDQWTLVSQSDAAWCRPGQVSFVDRHSSQILFFGGEIDNRPTNHFYSFDLSSLKFSDAGANLTVSPRAVSDATAVPLDDYTTLVLGGRSGDAWVSMQQIALWTPTGWTFASVANGTQIDSRTGALALPVFRRDQNGTAPINDVVLVGGTVAGRPAEPAQLLLRHADDQGWSWDSANTNASNPAAVLTLYETLASFSRPAELNGSAPLDLQLLTTTGRWTSVDHLSVPKSHRTSPLLIGLLSALLPFAALSAVFGYFAWRRRANRLRTRQPDPHRVSMLQRESSEFSNASMAKWLASSRPRQSLFVINPDTVSGAPSPQSEPCRSRSSFEFGV